MVSRQAKNKSIANKKAVNVRKKKFSVHVSENKKLDVLISYLKNHRVEKLTMQKISKDTGININFLKKIQKVIDLSRYG